MNLTRKQLLTTLLIRQLEQLLRVAEDRGYPEAAPILRMHLRAARLDCSIDAVRRGER